MLDSLLKGSISGPTHLKDVRNDVHVLLQDVAPIGHIGRSRVEGLAHSTEVVDTASPKVPNRLGRAQKLLGNLRVLAERSPTQAATRLTLVHFRDSTAQATQRSPVLPGSATQRRAMGSL